MVRGLFPRSGRSCAPLRVMVGLAAALLSLPAVADPPGVYAITGGTVHPASGPDIANGVVIIRNGLIEAVGANLTIPPSRRSWWRPGGW